MNNKKPQLNLMVLNPHSPPPSSQIPLPTTTRTSSLEHLHQRSHQGIPQWTMDETHDSWLPPTNYQWIYSHQPPHGSYQNFIPYSEPCSLTLMVPINTMVPISSHQPWTLLLDLYGSYQPHGSYQNRIASSHQLCSSTPMVPINPNGSYQIPSARFFNPNGSSQAWTSSFLSTPSQSPQTLLLGAATCSLPSWWKITSCSF